MKILKGVTIILLIVFSLTVVAWSGARLGNIDNDMKPPTYVEFVCSIPEMLYWDVTGKVW